MAGEKILTLRLEGGLRGKLDKTCGGNAAVAVVSGGGSDPGSTWH